MPLIAILNNKTFFFFSEIITLTSAEPDEYISHIDQIWDVV